MDTTRDYLVGANEVLDELGRCGVTDVVTVPDFVQMSIHHALQQGYLPDVRTVACCTEDEALSIAAGLYIGGRRPIVIMQNQGLYASVNALRALGLDARLPLVMLVGQFAREFSNLGSDPQDSQRQLVRNTERVLTALDVPFFRLEARRDIGLISDAWHSAHDREGAAAVLVGGHTAWSSDATDRGGTQT